MATPVVVKPFRICPRWLLKNPKDKFDYINIQNSQGIAVNFFKISRKTYYNKTKVCRIN